MRKNDIVLVNFPFSNLSETKLRPAVIAATPHGHNLILCQITTKHRNSSTFEISLPKNATSGDIRFDSNIYVDMIFTLHQSLVKRKLGTIENANTQKQIQEKISLLFF